MVASFQVCDDDSHSLSHDCVDSTCVLYVEWTPMYNPTNEQAEADRKTAYETGVPHGYVAQGDKYKGLPTISIPVVSELHTPEEYGEKVDKDGKHSGGPFVLKVSPKMRVEELRKVIMVRLVMSCNLCSLCMKTTRET